jgi:hypothetical protein
MPVYLDYARLTQAQRDTVNATYDPQLSDPNLYVYEPGLDGSVLCRRPITAVDAGSSPNGSLGNMVRER